MVTRLPINPYREIIRSEYGNFVAGTSAEFPASEST